MHLKKSKSKIIKRYHDIISWVCPIRGKVSEEREIIVYGASKDFINDNEIVSLEEITP